MAIPPYFRLDGCLEEGIHEADWAEFAARFGTNPVRTDMLAHLLAFCHLLHTAECSELYVDGSFATNKEHPGDVDVCFKTASMNEALFFLWTKGAQRQRFPLLDVQIDDEGSYLDFFQTVRGTGEPKGIVRLLLFTLPPKDYAPLLRLE